MLPIAFLSSSSSPPLLPLPLFSLSPSPSPPPSLSPFLSLIFSLSLASPPPSLPPFLPSFLPSFAPLCLSRARRTPSFLVATQVLAPAGHRHLRSRGVAQTTEFRGSGTSERPGAVGFCRNFHVTSALPAGGTGPTGASGPGSPRKERTSF